MTDGEIISSVLNTEENNSEIASVEEEVEKVYMAEGIVIFKIILKKTTNVKTNQK